MPGAHGPAENEISRRLTELFGPADANICALQGQDPHCVMEEESPFLARFDQKVLPGRPDNAQGNSRQTCAGTKVQGERILGKGQLI